MNDALEILNDLQDYLDSFGESGPYNSELQLWIDQKRSEFEPAKGDCCG